LLYNDISARREIPNLTVNPVRNSSGALNPVRDLSLNGINPAGIILKSNPAKGGTAEQRGIISNGVKRGTEWP
jgi:hypothetical protein